MSFRELIERLLPWFDPDRERARDAESLRIAAVSNLAYARANRVIAQYRAAEVVAIGKRRRVADAVAELRDAQEDARIAGEAVIAEVESKP